MPEGSGRRPAIVVSACLLGIRCNHRGRASPSGAVARLGVDNDLVPICPEVAGGLPIPRPAAEQCSDGSVRTRTGRDLTEQYRQGAAAAAAAASAAGARSAVLKARSPSCGCTDVYDGTFTRTLVPGEGVTVRALRDAGLIVRSDEELAAEVEGNRRGRATPTPSGSASMRAGALSSDG